MTASFRYERLPSGWIRYFIYTLSVALMIWLGLFAFGAFTGTVGSAAKILRDEISPVELNRKYEWFKDAYAVLESKRATLDGYKADRVGLDKTYGADASKWPRDVRTDQSLLRSEARGIAASYNNLAADYNAEMAKWHTRFINVGRLPAGGNGELPREVAQYIYE